MWTGRPTKASIPNCGNIAPQRHQHRPIRTTALPVLVAMNNSDTIENPHTYYSMNHVRDVTGKRSMDPGSPCQLSQLDCRSPAVRLMNSLPSFCSHRKGFNPMVSPFPSLNVILFMDETIFAEKSHCQTIFLLRFQQISGNSWLNWLQSPEDANDSSVH